MQFLRSSEWLLVCCYAVAKKFRSVVSVLLRSSEWFLGCCYAGAEGVWLIGSCYGVQIGC